MGDVSTFLKDSAARLGVSEDAVLKRVLGCGSEIPDGFAADMQTDVRHLFMRLDYELRIRNPGLHYSPRKGYLGYRRQEKSASPGVGERSQVFVSVLRRNAILGVTLPIDPEAIRRSPRVRDLSQTGHHGVGNVRVDITDVAELDTFFTDFDYWLRPTAKDPTEI